MNLKMNHTKALIILSVFFVVAFIGRFAVIPGIAKNSGTVAGVPEYKNPFESLVLPTPQAAYVYDAETGETLYSFHENSQLPLASLAKIMTVLVAADSLPENSEVAISKKSVRVEGDSGFLIGEKWSFLDLAHLTLVGSVNDGAAALAEAVEGEETFVDQMNKKARELGLEKTYFLNESGLDESGGTAGAYGSARDVARMLAYAHEKYPEIFDATRHEGVTVESSNSRKMTFWNTNNTIGRLPGALVSKTGTTPLAGGNLGVVFDAGLNHPIAAVVLGDDPEGRFATMEKLVETTRGFFATQHYE